MNTNRVYIRIKDDLKEFVTPSETKIVSDAAVSLLARQLALHANVSNFLERLEHPVHHFRLDVHQIQNLTF